MNTQNGQSNASDSTVKTGRRAFIRKSVYAAPAILTLSALPAFAKAGSNSQKSGKSKRDKKKDKKGKGPKGKKN